MYDSHHSNIFYRNNPTIHKLAWPGNFKLLQAFCNAYSQCLYLSCPKLVTNNFPLAPIHEIIKVVPKSRRQNKQSNDDDDANVNNYRFLYNHEEKIQGDMNK